MAKGKNVLTTGDVAKICHVAPRTVSKWFDNGQLKGYRIPGSKDRRIPVSELIRFMKVHNMPTTGLSVGKIRILVADSNDKTALALADALQSRADYEVQTVQTNFETGTVVQAFAPHVVLVSDLASARAVIVDLIASSNFGRGEMPHHMGGTAGLNALFADGHVYLTGGVDLFESIDIGHDWPLFKEILFSLEP